MLCEREESERVGFHGVSNEGGASGVWAVG